MAPGGVEPDLAAFGQAAAMGLGTGAPADPRTALSLGGEVLPAPGLGVLFVHHDRKGGGEYGEGWPARTTSSARRTC